jgi:hypothetical protein
MIYKTQLNFKLTALLLSFTLVSLPMSTNISYAQLLQPTENDTQLPPSAGKGILPNIGLPSTTRAVNITSLTKGQQVPLGKDLIILGTSIGNASTSNCQVIVGINGIKPYPSATGTGPGGPKDYSKWSFTLTPKYATLKPGPDNKITARYKCSGSSSNNNPNLVLISSVNVTGVATATNIPANQLQQQPPSIIENNATISASRKDTGIPWLP